jgi:hypothetical protein
MYLPMLLKNNMELISEPCGTYPKLTKDSRLLSALYMGVATPLGMPLLRFPRTRSLASSLADYLNDIAAKLEFPPIDILLG